MAETGPFVWHELRVRDLEEAERFYGAVFGWAFTDNPMGRSITHRGVVIGGASAVKVGLDVHWTPYIACADVDAAARAVAAGGIVTTGQPADVPGIGRIAPSSTPRSRSSWPSPRRWRRRRTSPAGSGGNASARRTSPPRPSSTAPRSAGRSPVGEGGGVVDAGGLRVAELVPDAATSGWLPFVRVEHLAEACRRIVALGGAAEEPVLWQGTAGCALRRDPQGVAFAVHAR